jgi:hypothetical protein
MTEHYGVVNEEKSATSESGTSPVSSSAGGASSAATGTDRDSGRLPPWPSMPGSLSMPGQIMPEQAASPQAGDFRRHAVNAAAACTRAAASRADAPARQARQNLDEHTRQPAP